MHFKMGDSGRIMACAQKNSVLSSDGYVRQLQYTASQQQDSHGKKHGQVVEQMQWAGKAN